MTPIFNPAVFGETTLIGNQLAEWGDAVTKEKFLTVRWNNLLSLVLGIPALLFVVYVLSTAVKSDKAAFVGLAIIGVLY